MVRRRRTEIDFANAMHAVWKDDKQCQCTNLLLYETLYGFPPRSDRRRTIPTSAVTNSPLIETSITQTTHGHAIDEALVLMISDIDISSQWDWCWGMFCSVLFLCEGSVLFILARGLEFEHTCMMCSLQNCAEVPWVGPKLINLARVSRYVRQTMLVVNAVACAW